MPERMTYAFPNPGKATIAEVGGKGLTLMLASYAGLPVPPGFIVSVAFFRPWLKQLKATRAWTRFLEAQENELEEACAALKSEAQRCIFTQEQKQAVYTNIQDGAEMLYAVRSSSPEEDREGASFAGGYETVLGVTPQHIEEAVRRAFASCLDYRVAIYKRENGYDLTDPKIAVVVQQQVESESAGVGFSLNPITNSYDDAVINSNWGLGETVVAGTATPDAYAVNKISLQIIDRTLGSKEISTWLLPSGGTKDKSHHRASEYSLSDAQVIELTKLIKQVEILYGKPMDIEWAYARGALYLLQARPVTSYVPLAPDMITPPGHTRRLYADITVIAQAMDKPISKMGTSVFRRLLKSVGGVIFARDITNDIDSSIPWISEGKIYFNLSAAFSLAGKKKVLKLVTMMDPLAASAIESIDEDAYISPAWKIALLPYGLILRLPGILLLAYRARRDPSTVHLWVQEQLRYFEQEAIHISQQNLPLEKIIDELFYAMVIRVFRLTMPLTLLSRYSLGRIKRMAGKSPDLAKLEIALPHNMTTEMGLALASVAESLPGGLDASHLQQKLRERSLPEDFLESWKQFLDAYGHRGPSEIDPMVPRYRDDPKLLLDLLLVIKNSAGESPRAKFERFQKERNNAYLSMFQNLNTQNPRVARSFAQQYHFFETFGGYRETHKHYLVFVIAIIRQMILRDAEALVASGRIDSLPQVFDLTLEQLNACRTDASMDLKQLARTNTIFLHTLASVSRPPTIIDSRGCIPRPPVRCEKVGEYLGVGVSSGVVRGRIKVLHTPHEKQLKKGEILVARSTDPGWTPLFVNAGGVILEIGGLLQHGALVAREYGLPCVAGIINATNLWKDGTMVEVDGATGIVRLVADHEGSA